MSTRVRVWIIGGSLTALEGQKGFRNAENLRFILVHAHQETSLPLEGLFEL